MNQIQKLKVSIAAYFLLAALSSTATAQTAKLELDITNIKDVKGSILVSFFKDESTFLKKEFQGKRAAVNANSMKLEIDLPPGEYSVSVIHDENDNGELDSNFMGIPKEGFAFGNNALGTFGPPDFAKTLVKLNPGTTKHSLALKYY
ncbi:MAG TPA: hypothetical protein DIW27_07485 [Cytophagales bacterium]|nr:hypothetical protein [Cytophagales bacterium]